LQSCPKGNFFLIKRRCAMKKQLILKVTYALMIVLLALAALPLHQAHAAGPYFTRATGNWNAVATWSTVACGGVAAAAFPVAGETVTICTGNVVTVNVNSAAADITINAASGGNNGITISGTNSLTVSGDINMSAQTANHVSTLSVGTGTLYANNISIAGAASGGWDTILSVGATGIINVTGNITFSGTAAQAQLNWIAASTTGYVEVGGNLTGPGSLTLANPSDLRVGGNYNITGTLSNNNRLDLTLNGTGDQTMSGTATLHTLTVDKASGTAIAGVNWTLSNNLSIAAGTLDLSTFTLAHQGAGSTTVTVSNGAALKVGGTNSLPTASFSYTLNAGSTVEYYGTNQTVNALTFSNLTLSGSGTKTPAGAIVIANGGSLNLVAGTFAAGTNLTMASTSTINRSEGSMTGTLQGAGVYDVNYTGTSKTAGSELSGSGLRNVTVNLSSSLTLDQNRSPDGDLTITAGIFDLGSFTINRSVAGGTLTVSNGATLMIGGTNTMPTNYTTHTFGATSTIEYSGGAQTVSAETYGNLVLSGTGLKTIPAGFTVQTTMWIKGTGGGGSAQVFLSTFTVNAANLWLGDSGVPAGDWGGTGCAAGGCNVNTTYFTASTGNVHVTTGSTPVTMNYFYAKGQGGSFSIDWSTGTETGNVGFNLYAVDANGKHKLNAQLIPSTGFTTHTPQDYSFAVSGVVLSGTFTFYLEDMDFQGKTMQHGPFALGVVYGQRVIATPTNWQQIQAECSQLTVRGKICFLAP
jgi:hypothetical protein